MALPLHWRVRNYDWRDDLPESNGVARFGFYRYFLAKGQKVAAGLVGVRGNHSADDDGIMLANNFEFSLDDYAPTRIGTSPKETPSPQTKGLSMCRSGADFAYPLIELASS